MTEVTDTDLNNGLIHFRSEIDNYGKGKTVPQLSNEKWITIAHIVDKTTLFDEVVMKLRGTEDLLCDVGTARLWVITQRVVVISYRRFGKTYLSHL
jgi:hypothetical protein